MQAIMTSLMYDILATKANMNDLASIFERHDNIQPIGATSILGLQVYSSMFNLPKINEQVQSLSQFEKPIALGSSSPSETFDHIITNNLKDTQHHPVISPDYTILKTIFESEASIIYICLSNTFKQQNTVMSSHIRQINKDDLYVVKLCYHNYFNSLEYKIMLLQHSSLVPCLDIIHQNKNIGIVMPCFHTTLTHVNLKVVDMSMKIKMLLVVAEGLQYLHEQGIYHGDIKPDNIFINYQTSTIQPDKTNIKHASNQPLLIQNCAIGDFGLSSYIQGNKMHPKNSFPFVTPFELFNQQYLSKEGTDLLAVCLQNHGVKIEQCVNEDQTYLLESGVHSDIWAFGMLCFYMLNENRTLFDFDIVINNELTSSYVHIHRLKRYMHFLKNPELYSSLYLNHLNAQWFNIINSCLQIKPEHRASLCHIISELKQMYINLTLSSA